MNLGKSLKLILIFLSLLFWEAAILQIRAAEPEKILYSCIFTTDTIKIDGTLDEPAWQKAEVLNFIIPITGEKPLSITEGKILGDNKYLYIGFKAYDKDIWGYFTKRDSSTYQEDVLEIFFKSDSEEKSYYNFEINALGTIYDAFIEKNKSAGGGIGQRWARWNCKNIKIKTKISGTLNNCYDVDECWVMEVRIPFTSLPTLKGRIPAPEENWLFLLGRYDYSVYLPEGRELSTCAHLSKINFHYYNDWVKLKFKK